MKDFNPDDAPQAPRPVRSLWGRVSRIDGTNLKRLTEGANHSVSRPWSSDGRRIVFNSQVRLNDADSGCGGLRIMHAAANRRPPASRATS